MALFNLIGRTNVGESSGMDFTARSNSIQRKIKTLSISEFQNFLMFHTGKKPARFRRKSFAPA